MYPIDFTTATPRDVIARSITCHPTTFAEGLREAARTHRHAADTMRNHQACAAANRLVGACNRAAELAETGDAANAQTIVETGPDAWISALNVACRLQCVPPSLRGDIAARQVIRA